MKELTLIELQNRVKENKSKLREMQKQRYQLARSLGFSANESVVLQNQSEATIRRLATEKGPPPYPLS